MSSDNRTRKHNNLNVCICTKLSFLTAWPSSVPQDDNLDVTTYTVLILEKSSVQISELAPGTAYLFRVQALPSGSSMEDEFETLPEGIGHDEEFKQL